jgi:hypothetical protein
MGLGFVVWCLVLAAVVPGAAVGATLPPADTAVLSDTERATGTTVTASALPGTVAAGVGDRIDVNGTTTFDSGTVRLYLVGPRGRFLDSDGATGRLESESVSGGAFEVTYDAFARRGTYRLLVVSPGGDGAFAATETLDRDALPTSMSQRQAVDLVKAAYGSDEVLDLSLRAAIPALSIDPISDTGELARGETVAVTGTSNRGDGTPIRVGLRDGGGRNVLTAEATVDATTGTWETTLDLTDIEPGAYAVFADDGETSASTTALVVSETTTPAETPSESVSVDETDDSVDRARETVDNVTGAALANATAGLDAASEVAGTNVSGSETVDRLQNGTANASANGTANASVNGTANASANGTANASTAEGGGTTSGLVPGFGVGAAVAALAVVALGARRVRRDDA